MRYAKITKNVKLEQLYVRATCLHCTNQYSFHIRHINQFKTCVCARATFYFTIKQYRNHIGVGVEWVGPWEQRENIEVDAIEIVDELPLLEEIDEEEGE